MQNDIDDRAIVNLILKVSEIPTDKTVMTECHNTLANYMNPYVPMQEGILSTNVEVTDTSVHYLSPWAHYQYTGIVYGPNIPIFENGVIVGWWSRPNKQPTGKNINYSTEKHAKATHHWDKAMINEKGKEFTQDITNIITDYLDNRSK